MTNSRELVLVAVAAISLMGAGCAKKKVAVNPPPPPPVATTPAKSAPPAATPASKPSTPKAGSLAPTPRYPNAATRARIDQLLARIQDAYFDYDKHTLRPDAVKALEADATELRDILKDYPEYKLTVEGHCDERGSAEYNLALGDARARAAKDFLVQAGIPSAQFSLISYGKEHPVCSEHEESCWQKNRRVHIVAMAQR